MMIDAFYINRTILIFYVSFLMLQVKLVRKLLEKIADEKARKYLTNLSRKLTKP